VVVEAERAAERIARKSAQPFPEDGMDDSLDWANLYWFAVGSL
jgi:hypothetical protein